MKKKIVASVVVLAALTLLLLLAFFLPCGMSLIVKDEGGHIYYMRDIQPDEPVSFGFKHSVEKVMVIDTFIVTTDGKLLLVNTTYGSMGAGLPSDESYQITSDNNGNFSIENINEIFEKVDFISMDFTRQHLVVSGEIFWLSERVPEGKPLIMLIEQNNPINMIINTIRANY